jgi:hypothetical protein
MKSYIRAYNQLFINTLLLYLWALTTLLLAGQKPTVIWQMGSIAVLIATQYVSYLLLKNRSKFRQLYQGYRRRSMEEKMLSRKFFWYR